MAGKFITLEGIDGSGKSTQSQKISQWLESFTGLKTVRTFEPGGWPDGERLREFILSSKNFSSMSELLLFLADRAEHVSRLILPSLADGFNVVCERWNESTIAYQSSGHKLDPQRVRTLITACAFGVQHTENYGHGDIFAFARRDYGSIFARLPFASRDYRVHCGVCFVRMVLAEIHHAQEGHDRGSLSSCYRIIVSV